MSKHKWLRVFAAIMLLAIGVADSRMVRMPGTWGDHVEWAFCQFRLPTHAETMTTSTMLEASFRDRLHDEDHGEGWVSDRWRDEALLSGVGHAVPYEARDVAVRGAREMPVSMMAHAAENATRDVLAHARAYGASPLLDIELARFRREHELANAEIRSSHDYGRPEIVMPTPKQVALQHIVSDHWPTGTIVMAGDEPWVEIVNRADLPDGEIKIDEHGVVITNPGAKPYSEDV